MAAARVIVHISPTMSMFLVALAVLGQVKGANPLGRGLVAREARLQQRQRWLGGNRRKSPWYISNPARQQHVSFDGRWQQRVLSLTFPQQCLMFTVALAVSGQVNGTNLLRRGLVAHEARVARGERTKHRFQPTAGCHTVVRPHTNRLQKEHITITWTRRTVRRPRRMQSEKK